MMHRTLSFCAPLLAFAAACAWDEGEHFAVLDPHIDARYEAPEDRDLGDGWQRLNTNFEVKVTSLTLDAEDITLFDGGSAGAGFDPANPPEGFSLCHNGHCHADDGSLVSYEEIERMLAEGEGAAPVLLLEPPVLALVDGVSGPLACVPECGLPLSNITLASMPVIGVRAEGLIRDSRVPARIDGEAPWSADLAFGHEDEVALGAPLELPADRRHDPDVRLVLSLAVTGALFDDIDWEVLPAVGSEISLSTPDAVEVLRTNLGELSFEGEITR